MNSFEWNKIAGAVLLAALAVVVVRIGTGLVMQPVAANPKAYVVAAAEETATTAQAAGQAGGQAAKSEEKSGITDLLKTASVDAGKRSAKKCVACHTFEEGGRHKIGPALWGIVGAQIGKQAEFRYSKAMASEGGSWTLEKLNTYLRSPAREIKGTNMAFIGLPKDSERANVIAYLRSLR